MPSADLDDAAATAARARCINNGQSCIAAKRFLVHQAFGARFVAGLERLQVGDPMADDTDVGPLATEQGLADVTRQVAASVASDPRLPFGGVKRSGHGRELSAAGIREFVNLQTVYLAAAR